MKGYKGFDKDLKCRGFQYEIGKEFTHEGEVEVCESGYHFCTDPLDVFRYYGPATSRFCEVESTGDESTHDNDSKVATSKLRVVAEIGLASMIKLGIKILYEKISQKGQATSGDWSTAATSGNWSTAVVTGKESIAVSTGYGGQAKGVLGCWLVLAERDRNGNILVVKAAKVDGKKIKADTLYTLKEGEFVEVEE